MAEPIAHQDFDDQIGAHSDRSDDDIPGAMPGDGQDSDADFDEFVAGEEDQADANDPAEAVDRVGQLADEEIAQAVARRLRKGSSTIKRLTGAARMTHPVMTKYEYAAIIGERATHIEQGMAVVDPRVEAILVREGIDQALDIAQMELEMVEIPFPMNVERRLAPNVYEVWGVRELRLPSQVLCDGYSPESTKLMHQILKETCPHDTAMSASRNLMRFALSRTR